MNLIKYGLIALALVSAAAIMNADTKGVEWKSAGEAMTTAAKSNRKVIMDVYTDWCGWCKRMDRDTYADSAVASYMAAHFVAAKMNPEKDGKVNYQAKEFSQRDFGAALGINGYPATAFFNEKGEVLTVVPGYIPAKEFLRILKYFGEDTYKTVTWEDYQKANP